MSRGIHSESGLKSSRKDIGGYDFDFSHCDTKYLTHGMHGYPARMPPQIPNTIFNHYLREHSIKPGDTVFDPFAGSGTTGVEAKLSGLNAEIVDINPLAVLLSKAKTTIIDSNQIRESYLKLISEDLGVFSGSVDTVFTEISKQHNDGGEIPIDRPEVGGVLDVYFRIRGRGSSRSAFSYSATHLSSRESRWG